ncbi:hypothetical protein N0V90_012152 [Kalmusia sp. IMI 367209]|nr:hypothetical protein N0V90_012152 [Kalmusia sp. IMI 367209]
MPPRRFKVEPIETTMRSSKEMHETVDGPKRSRFAPNPIETTTRTNRRFAVEPIETTTRSSKDTPKEEKEGIKRPGRFTPELVETSVKSHRRFAPEPIETTFRSSKDQPTTEAERPKQRRRFAPEPIETSTKTNRRFAPEPIETSTRSSRKKFADDWATASSQKRDKKPRKFAPQLIETARRSRRDGDSTPTLRRSDKTEATPLDGSVPNPPDNTPTLDFAHNPLFLEIQRATSPLNRRRMPRCRPSQHCFHVPDLDPIESSESESSTPASPITSPHKTLCRPYSYEKHSYKEPTRIRESVDERSSGYLLELAAKAAQKQLRDQEMAAFPNGDYYEHVDHFVDHDDESIGVNWELVAMRKHREKEEKKEEDADIDSKSNPRSNAAPPLSPTSKEVIGCQKNSELDRMRREARPPMLGKDIKFPRCHSPEPARFDTTQGCDAVRIAMCYLSEQTQQAEKGESLWCGQGNGRQTSRVSSLWSTPSSRRESKNGLWAGCCTSSESLPKGPTGILTPRIETADLLSPCPTPSASLLPPTPPASTADFACIDEKLTFALSIDEDYNDDFVTQVYNYLSLGYPSMAQPFDDELSRISKIPVSDLRQDDHLAESKGYIRLGEDGNLTSTDITEESCMRWRALRVYIREWAKQHPNMAGDNLAGAGIAVRKGSWAV